MPKGIISVSPSSDLSPSQLAMLADVAARVNSPAAAEASRAWFDLSFRASMVANPWRGIPVVAGREVSK